MLTACCICRQVPYLVLFTHFWALLCPHCWAFFVYSFPRHNCHSVHTGSDKTLHQMLPEPVCPYNGTLFQPSCAEPSSEPCCIAATQAARATCHAVLCSCEVCSWSHKAYACYIHTHRYIKNTLLLIYIYTLCILCRWVRVAATNRAGSRAFLGCLILVCWRHCRQNQLR